MPEPFEQAIMDSNPAFRPSIDLLNKEYEEVLMKKLNDNFKPQPDSNKKYDFTPRDLVNIDYKGQEMTTYGDVYKDKQGVE